MIKITVKWLMVRWLTIKLMVKIIVKITVK